VVHFYSPSKWEFPKNFDHKFVSFGMGARAAQELARRLNLTRPKGWIVIAGSAGGLRPGIQTGDSFVVREVKHARKSWTLNVPKELSSFPQAVLTSNSVPIWSSTEKLNRHHADAADIIDCELEFFLENLDPSLVAQVLVLRTVIDSQTHELNFFDGFRIRPERLLNPIELIRFIRFIFCFFKFRSGHSEFFKRVDRVLFLDDLTETRWR
jgi:hypothetical protein